jgi:hypothetical protein
MSGILNYVRNRNPITQQDSTEMSYTSLEDEASQSNQEGTQVNQTIPRSYSSTYDFKATSNELEDNENAGEGVEATNESITNSSEKKYYTVDQAVEKIGFGLFQFKLSMLSGLAWVIIFYIFCY